MSEAELHVLRARLRGGILNKARRGELRCRLPVGFVYDADGRVVLDPDQQVQESVRLLFQTFRRTGAAHATVKYFRQQGLLFPTRVAAGRAARASWRGGRCHWAAPPVPCTTRGTPAPTSSAGAAGASSPTGARDTNACRASSGTR